MESQLYNFIVRDPVIKRIYLQEKKRLTIQIIQLYFIINKAKDGILIKRKNWNYKLQQFNKFKNKLDGIGLN